MKNIIGIALLAVFVVASGCTPLLEFTRKDLAAGMQLAERHKGALRPDDMWAKCYAVLDRGVARLQDMYGPDFQFGLFSAAMRLHIIDGMVENLPMEDKAACGAVLFEIMMEIQERI